MLKLNLKKGPKIFNLRPIKLLAVIVLSFILLWQGFSREQRNLEKEGKQTEINKLKARLKNLEEKKKNLAGPENPETLNGAIWARNEWVKRREKSPVFILARLEKEKPGAVELKSLESGDSGGTIRMNAGDMDTASRYTNAVFGNRTGRITMEERSRNGIITVYKWND